MIMYIFGHKCKKEILFYRLEFFLQMKIIIEYSRYLVLLYFLHCQLTGRCAFSLNLSAMQSSVIT